MIVQKLVRWLRAEGHRDRAHGRLARWIGRSWARLTYAIRVEPTWLALNHHEVPVHDLPAGLTGLRLVQLSDFHGSRFVTPAYLGEAVELAQQQNGDVIVLTGDFVHKGFKHVERVARVLGRLSCRHGVYAVLGNHDYAVRNALGYRRYPHLHRAVADALRAQGIRVLHNEAVPIDGADGRLHLVGVADLWSRECDLERSFVGLSPKAPRVVLAHNPLTVELLDGQRCDLMLSGHTHGGQLNLPLLGRVTLGRNGRRFAAGMYHYRNTYLYVNTGVGHGFPIRYGVRPEVAVFTLRPAPTPPAPRTK